MPVLCCNRKAINMLLKSDDAVLLYAGHAADDLGGVPQVWQRSRCHIEIQYIVQGQALVCVAGNRYKAEAGDLIVFPVGTSYAILPDKESGVEYYCCGIGGKIPRESLGRLLPEGTCPIFHTGERSADVRFIFCGIYEQLCRPRMGSVRICNQLLQLLLTMLRTQIHHKQEVLPEVLEDPVCLGRNYIENNFDKKLRIEELSKTVHMSSSGFSHRFGHYMGIAPLQYAIRCRIGRAQMQLCFSADSIAEIGWAVGYQNLGNFNYQFRKLVGMSPRLYRRKWVGEVQLAFMTELWSVLQNEQANS